MNLFASLDSNLLVIAPGYPQALGSFNAKRGESRPLALQFLSQQIPQALAADIVIKFGVKVVGDYDGKFIVSNWENGFTFADGVTTNGSAVVTSAVDAGFTPACVGLAISGTGIPANTTILSYQSPTQITMSANATASATVTCTVTGAFNFTLTGSGNTSVYTLNPSWNTTKLNWLLGFDPYGFAQVTDIETIGDVSGSLDGKYFVLQDQNGSVGVWIALNNGGTSEPAGATACTRSVKITAINTNDSANTVATKLTAAFSADAGLTAAAWGNLVTFTDKQVGARTAAADGAGAAKTNFEFTVDIPGSTPGTLQKVGSVTLSGYIQWTDPATGIINSVDSFQVMVYAAGINGDEGIPTTATPAYPAPGALALLDTPNANQPFYIGTNARLMPISNGFQIQTSADGVTWVDGPSYHP